MLALVWVTLFRSAWKESGRFSVSMPDGTVLTFTEEEYQALVISPSDVRSRLIVRPPVGDAYERTINEFGGGYDDVEIRCREDGRAIWVVEWTTYSCATSGRPRGGRYPTVRAALDLDSGYFWGEGDLDVTYWDDSALHGEYWHPPGTPGYPMWARPDRGMTLVRHRFD
jgi:hypothetical protein